MMPGIKSLMGELTSYRSIPALLWVIVPVLVVRMHPTLVLPEAGHLYSSPILGDTRAWWKAVFVCGIALWMVFHLLVRLLTGWRPRCLRFAILLGVAAVAVLISTYTSEYPKTSWLGYTSFYEGAAVLLSYLVAMWYIAEMADTESARLLLLRAMGVIGLLNGCHGIAEGFGWPFWKSDLGVWLMGAKPGTVTYTFEGTRIAYGTVFQSNHYGLLMAMLCSLAVGMCFHERSRNWRFFWLAVVIATFFGLLFSQARLSILAFTCVMAVFFIHKLIAFIQKIRSAPGYSKLLGMNLRGAAIGVLFCSAVVGVLFGSTAVRSAINDIKQRSKSLTLDFAPKTTQIQSVGLQDNRIYICLSDQILTLEKRAPNTWITQYEGQSSRGAALIFGQEDKRGWRSAPIPGIIDGTLLCRSQGNIKLRAPDTELEFFGIGTRLWMVDANNRQLYASIPLSLSSSIDEFEGFLSARGYIWTRIWPVIRKHMFFGSGPGTFALSFPNLDLLERSRFVFGKNTDKGHGIWAMFLVQLGVIGFLLYCTPVTFAIWAVLRTDRALRVPLLMGILAHCLGLLTNDSTAGVTPIFCTLIGLAISDSTRVEHRIDVT